MKDPGFYEHIDPGPRPRNARDVLVSDQAGRANLLQRFADMGLEVKPDADAVATLLATIKEREARGFTYDGASASFELLVRRGLGEIEDAFELLSFRVIDERRFNAIGELVTQSEATIKVKVGGSDFYTVADGNGPVNALDHALRQALAPTYPRREDGACRLQCAHPSPESAPPPSPG
jgi:2-isopropylmalate synthase